MRAAPLLLLLAGAAGCGSCLNLGGRAYPCEMDSGLPTECPAKWRCGLELSGQPRCHLIGKPGPFVCAADEACEGWHCGADSVCYDRADAGAIACREGELDCAPGWRCNLLSQTCQNQDAGEPYLCASDDDCEQRWRCGPNGLCLDATAEGLRPPAPGLAATRFSPAWTVDAPVTVYSARKGANALLSGGAVHQLEVFSSGPTFGTHRATPVPSGVTALAAAAGRAFVATDGGVFRVSGVGVEPFAALAGAQLQLSREEPPTLAAWEGSTVFLVGSDADAGLFTAAPAPVLAIDFLSTPGQPTDWMWTATAAGLFVSPRDAGPPAFFPVALPRLVSSCPGAGSDVPSSVQVARASGHLVVEVLPADGGLPALDLYAGSAGLLPVACSDQGYTFARQCQVCPAGSRAHVRADDPSPPGFQVACVGPGKAHTTYRVNPLPLDAGCAVLVVQNFGRLPSSDRSAWAWVEDDGTVVHDDVPVTPSAASLAAGTAADLRLFDKAPGADLGFADVSRAAVAASSGPLAQFCGAVPGAPFVLGTHLDRGLALDRSVYVYPLVRGSAAVDAPKGILDGTAAYGLFDGGGAPAVLPVSCFEDGEPTFHAATGPTRDGGEVLVVGGEDRVWAIETARLALDAGVARILVRTVPAVAGRFQALAMVDPLPLEGSDYAMGYGLVSSRLFRIRARSSTSWLSEELSLPEGEPISVWADGANARVGYADGRVFSAASRVQLAGTTPSPVRAFAALCGEGFALTDDTLYRLVASDGGAIGTWVKVDLTGAQLPALSRGRLYGADRTLVVSTPGGVIGRLAVPACGQ